MYNQYLIIGSFKSVIRNIFLGLLTITTLTGCSKFVEVEPPKSQLLGELVFEEAGTALAALAGVYDRLRSEENGIFNGSSQGMECYLAQYADEMRNYSNANRTHGENFYKSIIYPDSEDIYLLWTTAYKQIYYVNAIIEGLDKSLKLTEIQKSQVKGEAIFIRAILYFYLVNLYGDVPYITGTDYLINKDFERTPASTVNANIVNDLLTAEQLVSENYPSQERVRISKYVVRAMLARVYLYFGNWEGAEAMSTMVIDNDEVFEWEGDIEKVFLKESKGTIWAFKPFTEGVNAEQAFTYILTTAPLADGKALNEHLLNAFETGDLRLQYWTNTYTEGSNVWRYAHKYKARGNTGTTYEYPILLRLEEQYLIRAEARAELENIAGAQDDINKIRSRAGLADTDADSKSSLIDVILHERQVELFTESGHRWFDLKRRGRSNAVLGALKAGWNATDTLLPIPEKELLVNPKLNPQNPGYQ